MSAHDDNHGSSPAAWTMVGILTLASVIIGAGFIFANVAVIIVGAVVFVAGLLVGKAMQRKGLGVRPPTPREPITLD